MTLDDADNIRSDTFACELCRQAVKQSHLLQQIFSEQCTHDKDYVDVDYVVITTIA